MNWEAISAIGEIVGATAVVVTLIYLAVQVRQGTKATQGGKRPGSFGTGSGVPASRRSRSCHGPDVGNLFGDARDAAPRSEATWR